MSQPSVLSVMIFRDGAYVGSEVFTEAEITIGRDQGVDLHLDDDHVAGQHAVLAHENGQATLLDLGSGFGTLINRVGIEHSYVTARDEIQIGNFTLKIKFVAPKPKAATSSRPSAPPPAASGQRPLSNDLLSPARPRSPLDDARAEQKTEVAGTQTQQGQRGGARAQGKVPTAVVPKHSRPPSESIDDLISSELGGITASLEISGSDVVEARAVSGTEAARRPQQGRGQPAALPLGQLMEEATASMHGRTPDAGHVSVESALDSAFFGGDLDEGLVQAPAPQAPSYSLPPAAAPAVLKGKPAAAQPARVNRPTVVDGPRGLPDAGPTGPIPIKSHSPPPAAPAIQSPSFSQAAPLARLGASQAPVQHAHAHAHAPHEDDDEYEDEDEYEGGLRPGFSLLRALVQKADYPSAGSAALEVICFAKDEVRSSSLLYRAGDRYVLGRMVGRSDRAPKAGHAGLKLARVSKIGEAIIEFPSSAEGMILDGEKKVALDQLKVPQNAVSKKGDVFRATLSTRANATLTIGDVGFHLRFVRPPPVQRSERGMNMDKTFLNAMGSSVFIHLLAGVIVGLTTPGVSYSEATEKWADVKEEIRDVEVKPPEPPPPEPEPEPEPEPVTDDTPPPPPEPEKDKPKPKKERAEKAEPKGVPKEEVKNAGVLGAIGKLNLAAPGKKSMVQAVSNIDAVKAPGGSNFRVGALVGKTPTSEVSVGGGGGGGPLLTKGGAALLKGGTGFATIGKRSGSQVRGAVSKVSASRIEAKGSISREEVAAVINKHLAEVQYCYEKTLIKDPGLKGKLVLEWTINTDGSVGKVKQQTSTLQNPEVSSCIISSLKRWQFPKPKGGLVVVSYPFIFSSVGF